MPSYIYGDNMTKQTRPRFNPEFKVEAAQLVLDQGYSVKEAAQAMGVGLSTLDKWVRKLKNERDGQLTSGYKSFAEAKLEVSRYITDYYSRYRPHIFNGGLTPTEA